MINLVPAYGRDYKSGFDARADWEANTDFLVADFFHPADGKPVNREQVPGETARIRFDNLRRVVIVPPIP